MLTIRPTFEREFLGLLENGTLTPLPDGHRYLTVAEELENYAKTNYPGIKSANSPEDARPLLTDKQKKAWEDLQHIAKLLSEYFKENNQTYPDTGGRLVNVDSISSTLQPYLGKIGLTVLPVHDPWNLLVGARSAF
ncbi:hypothetical protein [Paenibacillus riograndensis]|uniref:hypothetical protein n=1 Tax=Paenibacillus riograndensis TaxID=483937 RepID=UPI0011466C83|nr:hypothetical protein [Paenibacillus riograndensis]